MDVIELRELSQSHLQQVSTRMATNTFIEAEKLQEREAETLQQARLWNYQRHVACRDAALAMMIMDPENPGCRFFLASVEHQKRS